MPAFSLVWRPRLGHPAASPTTRRSPTHPHTWTPTHKEAGAWSRADATASAVYLSPAKLSAQNHLTSELLRTLSRMARSEERRVGKECRCVGRRWDVKNTVHARQ